MLGHMLGMLIVWHMPVMCRGGGIDETTKVASNPRADRHQDGETAAKRDSQPMMKSKGIKLAYAIHATRQVGWWQHHPQNHNAWRWGGTDCQKKA